MCRLQAVNGDCLRSTLNPDVIGLIAPVEDPVWADIQGLEGSPERTMPYKGMRGMAGTLPGLHGGTAVSGGGWCSCECK
jgi:hypothetical protein